MHDYRGSFVDIGMKTLIIVHSYHHGNTRKIAEVMAEALPSISGKKAFIFSTSGAPEALFGRDFIQKYSGRSHEALRARLRRKGFSIEGEFNCPGWNTNAFLWRIGGVNKGRPNAADLDRARIFARELARLG
jgi:flavodoxin